MLAQTPYVAEAGLELYILLSRAGVTDRSHHVHTIVSEHSTKGALPLKISLLFTHEFMFIRCMQLLQEARGHPVPWNWSHWQSLSHLVGDSKDPGPLREQQAFLIAEPFLQLSILLTLPYNIVINTKS